MEYFNAILISPFIMASVEFSLVWEESIHNHEYQWFYYRDSIIFHWLYNTAALPC